MLEAQTADIRALLFLSPSPTFQDFKEAWHAAPRRPDACLTVARRRIRRFSLIHDACPAGVDRQAYTQALFNAALASSTDVHLAARSPALLAYTARIRERYWPPTELVQGA
jgi:hypothetical protein